MRENEDEKDRKQKLFFESMSAFIVFFNHI